ncbi:MAG: hypothetical protein HY274_05150 [Gammaproteobacteria bacterium]|nr:hypothetical protein [Gammaproteobacteria bacterium]
MNAITLARKPLVIFILLALLMAATRYHHFGSALHLPDASLAVFFMAGFYLAGVLAFPVLLVEAGLIDYLAITVGGVSDFCVTPAYGFLIPAYGAMWFAGRWAAGKVQMRWQSLLPLFGALFVATSIAFLISNGAFYMLSGRFPDLSWAQYSERVAKYYPPYVAWAFFYVAFAAFVHWAAATIGQMRALRGGRTG